MTACVNRKHTKKVAAVVTASLVGALSLGVAPVAAVADTGIETLAADWTTGAVVSAATDGQGNQLSGDLSKPTFTINTGKFLQPTQLKGTYVTTDVTDEMLEYEISSGFWVRIDDARDFFEGETVYGHTVSTGAYKVRVTVDSTDLTTYKEFTFRIVNEGKLEGVQVKGTPTYNGTDQNQTISFVDGEGYDVTPVGTVNFTTATGSNAGTSAPGSTGVKQAGSYVATFTATDGQTYNVPFSIAKLDLSTAAVTIDDTTTVIPDTDILKKIKVNGGTAGAIENDLNLTGITTPAGDASIGTDEGVYTVTVSAKSNKSVTGSAKITYCVLDNNHAQEVYYGRDHGGDGFTKTIYLEDGDAFDASKISVKPSTTSSTAYSGDDLEITYIDHDNSKVVDASALANVGTYDLVIRIKPYQDFESGDWNGGTIKMTIKVEPTNLSDSENLAFFIDGELAGNSASVTYDGTDLLDRVDVVVKGSDGSDLVEGTDYTVEVKNADTNRKVDSIVDAGNYEIKVSPLTFKFSGSDDTLTLTVKKVQIGATVPAPDADDGYLKDFVYVDHTGVYGETIVDQNDAVAYTGSAVEVPGVQYPVLNADGSVKKVDGKVVYTVLSSDLYNIVSMKDNDTNKTVTEAVEEGHYTVKIALTDEAAKNYQLVDPDFIFQIREAGQFTDVDSTKWYSVPVEKAYSQWYINGISGTNLFAPEADITRADAVCIIYNMAGGDSIGDEDFSFDVDHGYNTGFNDVDGHAYFAKALAWARAFGVANGSNGEFRPYDQITREEFASLLANYAKAMGKFEAADASALDGMSDANTVSDWAKDNVAWAVENGIMGNGGFVAGQSNIIRAEVAAMAVNYQPEMIRDDVQPR